MSVESAFLQIMRERRPDLHWQVVPVAAAETAAALDDEKEGREQ